MLTSSRLLVATFLFERWSYLEARQAFRSYCYRQSCVLQVAEEALHFCRMIGLRDELLTQLLKSFSAVSAKTFFSFWSFVIGLKTFYEPPRSFLSLKFVTHAGFFSEEPYSHYSIPSQ
jgi:hypothetical protein